MVHEIGHTLGLDHSNVRGSIMAPFNEGYKANLRLDQDDINAVQKLYGRKGSVPTATTTRTTTPRDYTDDGYTYTSYYDHDGCDIDEFACEDGSSCVPFSYICDNENDCADGSDESYCGGVVINANYGDEESHTDDETYNFY